MSQKRPKVYLSKSNLCDLNLVAKVREDLQRFDVDIVEFRGGVYSSKDIKESDYLIIIPSIDESNEITNLIYEDGELFEVWLGKGQSTQIDDFLLENHYRPIIIASFSLHNILYYSSYKYRSINAHDWAKRYALSTFSYNEVDDDFLEIWELKEEIIKKRRILLSCKNILGI